MSERTPAPRVSPFTMSPRSMSVVGLLVFVAVLGMPVQAASYFAPSLGHTASAPAVAHVATTTAPHGITISNAVLNSPIGLREHTLLSALGQRLATGSTGLGSVLSTILPQTAPPAGVSARPAPDFSGGVNNYVGSSDCQGWGVFQGPNGQFVPTIAGSSIAQVGSSNQTLVAGGGSLISIFNVSGAVLCSQGGLITPALLASGYSNVFLSTNGGATWKNFTIPVNVTHWQNSADVANGSMTTGNDVVAAATNGIALEVSGYAPQCMAVPIYPPLACTSTLGQSAPWGYAVSRSSDGGNTWSAEEQVSSNTAFSPVLFPAICNANPNPLLEPLDINEHPSVATDGTNAVVSWDILHFIWDPANCTLAALQATVQSSMSTDGGLTWGAPVNVSGPVSQSPTLKFGATANTVYDLFADVSSANASTSGQIQWQWSKSTNAGATWSALTDLGLHNVNPTCYGCAASPDGVDTAQFPAFAVDNWSTSTHQTNTYVAWQDNETGSLSGQVSIAFERSINGGASWLTAQYLTTPSTSVHYLEPAVAVSPDGTVWVTYYGFGTSSGYYYLYGTFSTDGGATWSPQFQISSAASTPNSALQDIGYYMGSVGTSAGLVPIWSDCRSTQCASGDDVQLYTANVNILNISTTASSPVTAQVTVFGGTTSIALPLETGVDYGTTVSVKVPQNVPYNATYVDSFTGWAGLSTSSNYQTTFTYLGVGSLVAQYTPVPAAFIAGTFYPNGAGASLTLDSAPVTLTAFNSTAYQYTVSVPSGQTYYLNASEPKYISDNRLVGVTAGQTTTENFVLARQNGFLTGTLTPSSATLLLNGTDVSAQVDPATGHFQLTVPWGWYFLNASKPGFTSATCNGHEVQVNPNAATVCTNLNLVGGWISGVVNPAKTGLVLQVDGVNVNTTFGTFNASVPGGFHTVTATQPGYNLSIIQGIVVTPGRASIVNVSLTNHGHLAGVVTPIGALKNLALRMTNVTAGGGIESYDGTTGAFNVSLLGGYWWTVTASSSGYNTTTGHVYVSAGNTSNFDVVMNLSGTILPNCTQLGNCPPPQQNTSSSGIPLTLVLGIVVVIVVVAVVAMVLLMRRRGGSGGGESPPPPPEELYQGTSPSDLPKLQSDGSMGEGTEPPQ